MRLSAKDYQLIDYATSVAQQNSDIYSQRGMHVGCALLAKSGKVYKGINIKTSHSVCAEQVALGQALACGEREFETLVAVKLNNDGTSRVVSPCGLCRYLFDKLDIKINFIVEDVQNRTILKVPIEKLLPYPYEREISAYTHNKNSKK